MGVFMLPRAAAGSVLRAIDHSACLGLSGGGGDLAEQNRVRLRDYPYQRVLYFLMAGRTRDVPFDKRSCLFRVRD